MRVLLLLTGLFFLSGCQLGGYDRHYIVSDTLEEVLPVSEEDESL